MIRSANAEQKSWLISVIIHVMIISTLLISVAPSLPPQTTVHVPIELAMIEPKKQAKKAVQTKQLVQKKGAKQSNQIKQPTSLPGDRIQPAISKAITPVYPKQALNNDWQGTVRVKVMINRNGGVASATVQQSSGHSILDQAFIVALKNQYKFKPKRVMGKNTDGALMVSHTFQLGGAQ
tara:strand:+ start:2985 stop:3521 length:537 start_codon:yes stop_codon:yes gene_type:complete